MSEGLWPHQKRALQLAGREFASGHLAVCIVMSTGAGKTRTGGAACVGHVAKRPEGKIVWCAHRDELVTQAYDDLTALGLECGVVQANAAREYNPYRQVQIASTQTLVARGMIPDATMVVLDEMHHYASDKWEALALEYRRRRVPMIGLTATPIRKDGRGFEGIMDALVCPITMRELIDEGFLVPYELVAPDKTLDSDEIARCPVDAYLEHARGRKCIVFAANVKCAKSYADKFNSVGVPCAVVWGDMDPSERRRVLAAYKAGELQVLTNVGVLTEGFDDKPTSCTIVARSVSSLSLYLQMCGRALRASPETGKVDAVIIDLNGNCKKASIGEPTDDRDWTLEGLSARKKNLEQAKERFCIICKQLLDAESKGPACDFCEYVRPEDVGPAIVNVKLVKYAALQKDTPEQRRARFNKWKLIGAAKKWSDWAPRMKYKALYGEMPPRAWW